MLRPPTRSYFGPPAPALPIQLPVSPSPHVQVHAQPPCVWPPRVGLRPSLPGRTNIRSFLIPSLKPLCWLLASLPWPSKPPGSASTPQNCWLHTGRLAAVQYARIMSTSGFYNCYPLACNTFSCASADHLAPLVSAHSLSKASPKHPSTDTPCPSLLYCTHEHS